MEEFREKVMRDPFASMLGIKIEEAGAGYARCSVTVKPEMLNFLGMLHGGFVFSLADVAFSAASNSDYSPSFALDTSISFLKSASPGDRIIAEARRIDSTKRTGLYRMEVRNNSELMAVMDGRVFRKV